MRKQILLSVIVLLAGFVFHTTLRIEYLNVKAGSYLPRQDRKTDGTFSDGTWRISPEHNARDRLRETVGTLGLAQYLLIPLLLALSIFTFFKARFRWVRMVVAGCCVIALFALTMLYYRGYYSSLGY